jgi:hypothetical protein
MSIKFLLKQNVNSANLDPLNSFRIKLLEVITDLKSTFLFAPNTRFAKLSISRNITESKQKQWNLRELKN